MQRLAVVILALALASCGDGVVHLSADAARPVVDPAPYYMPCGTCAAPYECTIPDLEHDPPANVCLIPCDNDGQCPADNFCNGVSQIIDIGASRHCANNP